ncbi:hypothetical protein CACET_c35640 [Clostridium aceticum]|uniref:Uncharacterized protein n=1 Tax=Clostridium aceticum TaxID=84022 RepID=A0A0D8I5Q4_9CLOT|nr:hypothetical protein [Clostridium aceticum]AKL96995.1 hypothetical protein CACET_c35640 [Clostridium aceticum]KJF25630.1 hypothetical protein TZ02_17555 [Clostridium aceticum]
MKKKLEKDRNIQIILGFALTLLALSRLSMDGLSGLAIFTGSVGVLAFLAAYKSHKEIIKNDNN